MKAFVDRDPRRGACARSSGGRRSRPTPARAPSASIPSWLLRNRDGSTRKITLVGLVLSLPGRRRRARRRPRVRPQGARRVGLRRAQDRRPAPERRAALLQRRPRTRVARGLPGGRARFLPRDLGGGAGDAPGRGRRDLPVRHRLLVLHAALPQHDRGVGSGELLAGAAEGQDAQGAARETRSRTSAITSSSRRGGEDFASTFGVGGVVGTNFAWPGAPGKKDKKLLLTPRARGEVGLLGQALPGEAAVAGRVPRRRCTTSASTGRRRTRSGRATRSTTRSTPTASAANVELRGLEARRYRVARLRERPRPRHGRGAAPRARGAPSRSTCCSRRVPE